MKAACKRRHGREGVRGFNRGWMCGVAVVTIATSEQSNGGRSEGAWEGGCEGI